MSLKLPCQANVDHHGYPIILLKLCILININFYVNSEIFFGSYSNYNFVGHDIQKNYYFEMAQNVITGM